MSQVSALRLMSYNLEFKESALKEWRKLDSSIRELFKKRLAESLIIPRIESARLAELPDCYKIKLRNAGYRLVYQVCDDRVVVMVIAVGKRENIAVYKAAKERI
jgi:mRNA interferase RelE/StbE